MPGPLNRRQLAGLGAVVVGGWAVGQVLRRTAPIGRDVGPTADLILAGNGSPEDGPADATLRLAVFTDYRCPACRHGFSALEEAVQRDGKVRVIYPTVHRALMTDSRTIDDDVLRDVVMRAGGDWLRAMTWLAAHADAVAARLRANGQEAYSIGLAGTPGYLAGPMLVMGAIDASDFQRLFARAREES